MRPGLATRSPGGGVAGGPRSRGSEKVSEMCVRFVAKKLLEYRRPGGCLAWQVEGVL